MRRFPAYKKEAPLSYALGVFPTLELLAARPEAVRTVVLAARGERNEGVGRIRELCVRYGIPVEVDDAAVERLSRTENAYAVGVFEKYELALSTEASHVVLVEPSDRGNLGTIMRTMLGFGYQDLAVVRPAVDGFDPKVVRAAMGAVFRLRIAYFESFEDYRQNFNRGLYSFMLGGDRRLGDMAWAQPHSLVFGNEGAGLPAAYGRLGESVQIEQTYAVDSLNLAVAVGVALHQAYIWGLRSKAK